MTLAPLSTAPTDAPQQPSQADALVSELLRTNGNMALATERLGLSFTDVLKLLDDPQVTANLNLAVRNQVTISAFNAVSELAIVLPVMLGELEPNDAFRTFTSLVQAISALTAPAKNTPSVAIQNNIFTAEDAEVARGKLLRLVARTYDDTAIASAVADLDPIKADGANPAA